MKWPEYINSANLNQRIARNQNREWTAEKNRNWQHGSGRKVDKRNRRIRTSGLLACTNSPLVMQNIILCRPHPPLRAWRWQRCEIRFAVRRTAQWARSAVSLTRFATALRAVRPYP